MHLDNPNYYLVFDRQDCFIAEYTQKELSNLRVQATDEVPTMQEIIASWDRMHAKDAPHRFVEYTPIQTHPLPKDHQGNYTPEAMAITARVAMDAMQFPLGVVAVLTVVSPHNTTITTASNCSAIITKQILESACATYDDPLLENPIQPPVDFYSRPDPTNITTPQIPINK